MLAFNLFDADTKTQSSDNTIGKNIEAQNTTKDIGSSFKSINDQEKTTTIVEKLEGTNEISTTGLDNTNTLNSEVANTKALRNSEKINSQNEDRNESITNGNSSSSNQTVKTESSNALLSSSTLKTGSSPILPSTTSITENKPSAIILSLIHI